MATSGERRGEDPIHVRGVAGNTRHAACGRLYEQPPRPALQHVSSTCRSVTRLVLLLTSREQPKSSTTSKLMSCWTCWVGCLSAESSRHWRHCCCKFSSPPITSLLLLSSPVSSSFILSRVSFSVMRVNLLFLSPSCSPPIRLKPAALLVHAHGFYSSLGGLVDYLVAGGQDLLLFHILLLLLLLLLSRCTSCSCSSCSSLFLTDLIWQILSSTPPSMSIPRSLRSLSSSSLPPSSSTRSLISTLSLPWALETFRARRRWKVGGQT